MELIKEFRLPPEALEALYASKMVFFSSSVELGQLLIQCFLLAHLLLLRQKGGSLAWKNRFVPFSAILPVLFTNLQSGQITKIT
jgi:hypothetical protein